MLTSELAKASVKGHQGKLSDKNTVMATAKYFIGDGSTDFGTESGNASISLKRFQNVYYHHIVL